MPVTISISISFSLSISHPSINPSIHPSVRPSIHPSIHLSIWKEAILRDFFKKWSSQLQRDKKRRGFLHFWKTEASLRDFFNKRQFTAPKRQTSARLPPFLKLTTSKQKQFRETSSKNESSQLQSDKILLDRLHFWSWQHQSRSNSARPLQKKKVHSSKATNFGETSSIFEVDNIKTEAIPRDVFKKWKFTAPKRQNFARPPPFLKLTTSKPKQFCETSSKKESSQLQSDKLRQDFLHFWSWQHQNRSNSARRLQKMKVHSSKATKFC